MITVTDEEFEAARRVIEDTLVELRDSRIQVLRNNGLCIKERDGSSSSIVRMPIESALKIFVDILNMLRED